MRYILYFEPGDRKINLWEPDDYFAREHASEMAAGVFRSDPLPLKAVLYDRDNVHVATFTRKEGPKLQTREQMLRGLAR